MKKVAVVNYNMGNLDSVARAIKECGSVAVVTAEPRDLENADAIILPGVGAFADGMKNLQSLGLIPPLNNAVLKKRIPFLGICLGMQLLATKGFEGGENKGFGWIPGEVRRFKASQAYMKIPHIGWNEVNFSQPSPLFNNIASDKDFYFVHSYHFVCDNSNEVLAWSCYCGKFVSAVGRGNIFGVQFHPEKSLHLGLKLLSNFLSL
jgi:glutamine amidotransferase